MIRLERLKDSTRESGVVGEKVGKLIWGKMKKLECHVKDFEHDLVVMGVKGTPQAEGCHQTCVSKEDSGNSGGMERAGENGLGGFRKHLG